MIVLHTNRFKFTK